MIAKCVNSSQKARREVLVLKQLKFKGHKHFPKLLGESTLGNKSCFFMEQEGKDIGTLCPRGSPLDIRQVVTFGMQLVRRLEQLHSIGILHNDLKLQNIVIGRGPEENNIKLIDFGISTSCIKNPSKFC